MVLSRYAHVNTETSKSGAEALPCRIEMNATCRAEGSITLLPARKECVRGPDHVCACTGNINCSVQGPLDKGNILEDLLLDIAAASGDGSSPCVYIGDSVGDLSALLVANRPVVLGNNAMLQHALHTFGCAYWILWGKNLELKT